MSIFLDGKQLNPSVIALVQQAKAMSHVRASYRKLWDKFFEQLPVLDDVEFWKVLNAYRKELIIHQFQYGRTNGVKQAAEELCRKAWIAEGEFPLNTITRFAKTYCEVAKRMRAIIPDEYGNGDNFINVMDNLPLCGEHFPINSKYLDVESFCFAVRSTLANAVDERLVSFIVRGENYNRLHLHDAVGNYMQQALAEVECPIIDDSRYLRIDVDRETMVTLLDKTTGPLTVQVKLDDEGVVLDLIDNEGEAIDSAWRLYAEAGVQVTPEST